MVLLLEYLEVFSGACRSFYNNVDYVGLVEKQKSAGFLVRCSIGVHNEARPRPFCKELDDKFCVFYHSYNGVAAALQREAL